MRSVRFGTCCSPHQFSISQSVGHGLDNKSVVAKLVLQQTVLMYQHPLHLCVHNYKQAAALVLPQNLTVCRLLLRLHQFGNRQLTVMSQHHKFGNTQLAVMSRLHNHTTLVNLGPLTHIAFLVFLALGSAPHP